MIFTPLRAWAFAGTLGTVLGSAVALADTPSRSVFIASTPDTAELVLRELDQGTPVWISGEALRFLLAGDKNFADKDRTDELLRHLEGVLAVPGEGGTSVSVHFTEPWNIAVEDAKKARAFHLYEVDLPQVLSFQVIKESDSVASVIGLSGGDNPLGLKVKLPLLPDGVRLRKITTNFETGEIQITAGILWNLRTIVASAEISSDPNARVDVWSTIARNVDLLIFPLLAFSFP